ADIAGPVGSVHGVGPRLAALVAGELVGYQARGRAWVGRASRISARGLGDRIDRRAARLQRKGLGRSTVVSQRGSEADVAGLRYHDIVADTVGEATGVIGDIVAGA